MLARGAEAADAARRRQAASRWPAVLARGDDPPEPPESPETPAIGGGGRRFGFCAEAGSAWFAAGPSAVLADPPEPPGTPAIGGGGRLAGFCVEAAAAGFAGWLYAIAGSVVAAGGSGSVRSGNALERP